MENSSEIPQQLKKELPETSQTSVLLDPLFIDIASSDSDDSDSDSDSSGSDDGVPGIKRPRGINGFVFKKRKKGDGSGVVLPAGFLDPLPGKEVLRPLAVVPPMSAALNGNGALVVGKVKQFWKAGDYDVEAMGGDWEKSAGIFVILFPNFWSYCIIIIIIILILIMLYRSMKYECWLFLI